jgi:hypothetical protein
MFSPWKGSRRQSHREGQTMRSVKLKTSTIFVSVGGHTQIYRSVGDMPDTLRKRLEKTTTGSNAATILIADRNGKEELLRALQGAPASLPLRMTEDVRRKRAHQDRMDRARARRYYLEILLIGILAFLVWILSVWR